MKNRIHHILGSFTGQFGFFYQQLGYRLFLVLGTGMLVAILDGLGLAMFLPLLQMVADSDGTANPINMGKLDVILDGLSLIGLPFTLTIVLLVMLAFFAIKGALTYLANNINVANQEYFIRKMRLENILALSAFRYDLFVNADAGRIQNTLSGEVERVSRAFSNYMQILRQGVMVVVYAGLAVLSDPVFALLVAVGGALTNLVFRSLFRQTKALSRRLSLFYHGFQGLLIQQVAFFKYLRATGQIIPFANQMTEKVHRIEELQKRIGVLRGIMDGVREPLLVGVIVAVILFQVNVMGGSLGLILLSILFFYRALTSVMQVQSAYNNYLGLYGSMASTRELLAEFHAGREVPGMEATHLMKDSITLQQVDFAYHPGRNVLTNLSLVIRKNETIALVGESGAGKTTLMNILSGLLVPTAGRIFLDGQEVDGLNGRGFQQRIGYITQEPVIFDDTVFNNVTFWADKSADNLARFWEALDRACMDEFVRGCPDREEARLGNNGINLSGGQKQRISIARELYKDVDILFLDEATSALDSGTEQAIHQNLALLHGRVTIVIIAHRLSTIRNADRLVLMQNGCIEATGPYRELEERSKTFRQMVELQEL